MDRWIYMNCDIKICQTFRIRITKRERQWDGIISNPKPINRTKQITNARNMEESSKQIKCLQIIVKLHEKKAKKEKGKMQAAVCMSFFPLFFP